MEINMWTCRSEIWIDDRGWLLITTLYGSIDPNTDKAVDKFDWRRAGQISSSISCFLWIAKEPSTNRRYHVVSPVQIKKSMITSFLMRDYLKTVPWCNIYVPLAEVKEASSLEMCMTHCLLYLNCKGLQYEQSAKRCVPWTYFVFPVMFCW